MTDKTYLDKRKFAPQFQPNNVVLRMIRLRIPEDLEVNARKPSDEAKAVWNSVCDQLCDELAAEPAPSISTIEQLKGYKF